MALSTFNAQTGLRRTKIDPFGPDPCPPKTVSIPVPKAGQALEVHPSFHILCNLWQFLRWSYRGGYQYKDQVDASLEDIFVPHERETDDKGIDAPGLSRRKRQSVYKNYVRPIVDRFNDFVFREANIVRDTSTPNWAEWILDVDDLGTPLPMFMRQQMRHAQVLGRHFIIARSSRTAEFSDDVTAAQAEAAGFKVWLERAFPIDVFDWRRSRGTIREALIRYDDQTAVLYRQDDFIEMQLDEAGTIVKSVDEPIAHRFGRFPVIEVAPFDETRSQIEDIAELNKQILNLDSLLRAELSANHFTQFVITGANAKQVSDTKLGTYNVLCIPNPEAKFDAMGSDTSQAEGIRGAIADDIKEIFRLAGLVSGDPLETGPAESGVAKAWRFHEVESKLGAIADEAQRVETLIGRLWARGDNSDGKAPEDPSYPDNFDVPDLAAEIDRSLSLLDSPNVVPSVKTREMTALADSLYPDLDAAGRTEIETESEALYNQTTDAAAMAAQTEILDQSDEE